MATDGSQALGAPQLAGTFVNQRGMAKNFTAAVAGRQVGGVVGHAAAGALTRPETRGGAPDFGRDAYVAVSESELALVKTKQGLMKLKITDEVLARAPLGAVAGATVGAGKLACPLTIEFADGVRWELDVPRAGKKSAQRVVDALLAAEPVPR